MEFDKLKDATSALCFSVLGREGIAETAPIMERKRRIEMIGLVTDFRRILNETSTFPAPQDRDLRPLIQKIKDGTYHLSIPEIVAAGRILAQYKAVARFLSKTGNEKLEKMVAAASHLPDMQTEVTEKIDENGEIKDNATKTLKTIRRDFARTHKGLIRAAERLVSEKRGFLQDELFTTRDERIVLPVMKNEKQKVPGIVHGMSQTQGTVFIEPMELVDLNNEYATLRLKEEQEIKRILRLLTEILINNIDTCVHAVEEMKVIDTLYGIAAFSEHYGFSEPQFSHDRTMVIHGGRHPLLVVNKGRENVVAFDVHLGNEKNLLLISGPNMGGKTVLLKSIGIITVMAYAGMHISAHPDSVIPAIEHIYADIGDEQSIERNLSTFSSHIRHISNALRSADEKSLVLLDEIGVGTDPEEGMGIAMAALEHLARSGALTFASTHYGKLKHFAAGNESMVNGSMEFDMQRGLPTYHLSIGIPGSSHGFAIAEQEGFPPQLLEKARNYLDENELKTEELVVELERLRKESEVIREDALQQKERYETLSKQYEERYGVLKQKEKALIEDARERAENMVVETRKQMEQVICHIRETQASKSAIKESKSRIEQKIQSFKKKPKAVKEKTFERGDFVYSKKLGIEGMVVEVLDGYVKVQSENARFIAPSETLEVQKMKRRKPDSVMNEMDIEMQTELDIRGLMVEEAKPEVIRFIDRAVLSNLKNVRIIHGKGTGALREAVAVFLKNDRRVDNYRLGYHTEGGSGVTVVTLKEG